MFRPVQLVDALVVEFVLRHILLTRFLLQNRFHLGRHFRALFYLLMLGLACLGEFLELVVFNAEFG